MKILFVSNVRSHIGQFHTNYINYLRKNGHHIEVSCYDNSADKDGYDFSSIDAFHFIPLQRSPFKLKNLKAISELTQIIKDGNYDIIHCHTPMGAVAARTAAKRAKTKAKVIYTAHGFHFYEGAPKKNWMVFYPIEKYFSRKNDTLITITKEDYRLAKEKFHCQVAHIHGVGVDEKRYFPVDEAEKRRLRQQMGYGEHQKLLLCVGELLPNKNQKMAIRAMKTIVEKYPDAILLIAGNGPEKDNLEAEIKACGVENNVKMLGYCTHLQDYQHIVDVLVSCSYREGLPLNIVEAMLSGTPVVASINRGHKELIQDGETGFLVSANDDKAMADRVLKLLDDEVLAERVGQTACQYAMDYSFTAVKRELEAIYFE